MSLTLSAETTETNPQSKSNWIIRFLLCTSLTVILALLPSNANSQMVFFPSTMMHWTNTYLGDAERITVAFDIYSEEWFNYDVFEDSKKHYVKI